MTLATTHGGGRLVVAFPVPRVGQDLAFALPGLPPCRVERVPSGNGGVNLAFDVPDEVDISRTRRERPRGTCQESEVSA